MLSDARDAIEKGKGILSDHVDGFVGEATKRGKELARDASKQAVGFLALAAKHGFDLLEEWGNVAAKSIPRKKRRSGLSGTAIFGLLAGAAAVGFVLFANSQEKRSNVSGSGL